MTRIPSCLAFTVTRGRSVAEPFTTLVGRIAVQPMVELAWSAANSLCFAATMSRANALTTAEIALCGKGFRSPVTVMPAPEMATSRSTPNLSIASMMLRKATAMKKVVAEKYPFVREEIDRLLLVPGRTQAADHSLGPINRARHGGRVTNVALDHCQRRVRSNAVRVADERRDLVTSLKEFL